MQQNDDDAADGDEEGCSAAESLLQALSKSKKLKRFKPPISSLGVDESICDSSLRNCSNILGASRAVDAAAASAMPPIISAHIQQLSKNRCA
jgi:hypothetical protein